ncbi:hypothetical protein [Streptomyces sp. NPDC048438]|uniref:hypothetical protein n=1 Tax=Streptomyces sp. NPDC048438 TaxID=3365551 RepID=UPI0037223E54
MFKTKAVTMSLLADAVQGKAFAEASRLAGRGVEPSDVDSRMFSRSVSAIAAKNANSGLPGPIGS